MALTWRLDVDWDADGVFEANEAGRMIDLVTVRGRRRMFQRRGKGFERQRVGKATITLNNYDGRYDPWNSSSPLYPNVLPAREAKITVNDGATTYPVIRGFIREPSPLDYADPKVKLILDDGWALFRDRTVRRALQTSMRTDAALDLVLAAAGWPMEQWRFGVSGQSEFGQSLRFADPNKYRNWGVDLGVGSDTLDYWWCEGNALDAIYDLVFSEMGAVYVAGDGQLTFRGRAQLYNQTSALTLSQDQILKDFSPVRTAENVRNIISVIAHPIVVSSTGDLWTLRDAPQVAPGESITLVAEFKNDNRKAAAQNVVAPVGTTDYSMNTKSNGSGTDLTSDFSVTATTYSMVSELKVTNNGTQSGFITLLKNRGDALDQPDAVYAEAVASASDQEKYLSRSLELDLPWQQNWAKAQDFATWLLSWMGATGGTVPPATPIVQLEDRPTIQFAHELFTRLTLDVAKVGLYMDFRVGQIRHEWLDENGQGVRSEWQLEPIDVESYWQFPTKIGTLSKFAY